jgi:uncharacterized protein (TIGR02391 family)
MVSSLTLFERITRRAYEFTDAGASDELSEHPFSLRNISPELPAVVKGLFDNGHYSQATFEAYKFLDKEILRHSKISKSGFQLMMDALGGASPTVRLTPMLTASQQDEQKGYQFIFSGAVLAIRNPRGHEHSLVDDPDTCLDHLALASMLVRRLSEAGYK